MAEPVVIDAEKQAKLDKFVFNALNGDNPAFDSARNWMKKGGRLDSLIPEAGWNASIFHHAVKNGWVKQVEFLVENGADINILDNYGQAPIHFLSKVFRGTQADWNSMTETMLKDPKLDLNIQDTQWKRTVFHMFPQSTNQDVLASITLARLLLSKKDNVDLKLKDIEGNDPLTIAIRRKEKGLITAYEDYIAAHGGAAAKPASEGAASGNVSAEEIKVMKELLLAISEVIGESVGEKRGGLIRELTYKLQHL